MGWEERITVNPAVRSGKPCVKDFPGLTRDDIRASLAFAAARERRLSNSVA